MIPPVLAAALLAAATSPDHHAHESAMAAWQFDPWTIAAHGFVNVVYDHQGGRRGDDMTFANSMFMGMASRTWREGTLELRGMLSLDPTIAHTGPVTWSAGGLASYLRPAEVTRIFYGERPGAYMLFLQARL